MSNKIFFKIDKRKNAATQILDLLEVLHSNYQKSNKLAGPTWPPSEHNSFQRAKAEVYLSTLNDVKEFAKVHMNMSESEIEGRLYGRAKS